MPIARISASASDRGYDVGRNPSSPIAPGATSDFESAVTPPVIDLDPSAETLLRETDRYLAGRSIGEAGALLGFVEAIGDGVPYTEEALWQAVPGLKPVWNDYQTLILETLTIVFGSPPTHGEPILPPDYRVVSPAGPTEPRDVEVATVDEWIEDRDLLSLYQHEVRSIPRLKHEATVALARQRDAGDPSAIAKIVAANLRLVVHMAIGYRDRGVDVLDLIQEGNQGLIRAAEKFDWRLGYQFSTYATAWIRQTITRAIADDSRTIRLPVHVHEQIGKRRRAVEDLEIRLGRPPETTEVAGVLECSAERVHELERAADLNEQMVPFEDLRFDDRGPEEVAFEEGLADGDWPVQAATRSVLLPTPADEQMAEECAIVDGLVVILPAGLFEEDVSAEVERAHFDEAIEDVLDSLTKRERRVLHLRFGFEGGDPRTLEEVGVEFGVTRERIRQIEAKALRKLRQPPRSKRLRAWLDGTPSHSLPHESTVGRRSTQANDITAHPDDQSLGAATPEVQPGPSPDVTKGNPQKGAAVRKRNERVIGVAQCAGQTAELVEGSPNADPACV
ncbi:MAG: sigma-70 family RNA polymerase sigma factor, partial [Candidatus Dormibacteraceae bacterium]